MEPLIEKTPLELLDFLEYLTAAFFANVEPEPELTLIGLEDLL